MQGWCFWAWCVDEIATTDIAKTPCFWVFNTPVKGMVCLIIVKNPCYTYIVSRTKAHNLRNADKNLDNYIGIECGLYQTCKS